MARIAVETYGADIVVPLDADEFLHCADGKDPREILQGLKDDTGHWLIWPFCLPPSKPFENGVFLPAQFDQYIYQANVFKLAVGAKMLKGGEFIITRGNHYLQSMIDQNIYGGPVVESLRLAHYPIRSAEQAMTKAIVGWVSEMCTLGRPEGASAHWQRMYNIIKETGYLQREHLLELCQQYMFSHAPIAPAAQYTVNSGVELKYTDYGKAQKNFLKIILTNYEHVVQRLMSRGAGYSAAESMKAVNS
jgi:hypothetical protein